MRGTAPLVRTSLSLACVPWQAAEGFVNLKVHSMERRDEKVAFDAFTSVFHSFCVERQGFLVALHRYPPALHV
jgi:hypothetical protein